MILLLVTRLNCGVKCLSQHLNLLLILLMESELKLNPVS